MAQQITVGYYTFPDGSYIKFYRNHHLVQLQQVYVEERTLYLSNSQQKQAEKWRRWIRKGIPPAHMIPSQRAGPRPGTNPLWPPTLPELSLSLTAALFLLIDSCRGYGSRSLTATAKSKEMLQVLLSILLGCVQASDEADDIYALRVSLTNGRSAMFPLECKDAPGFLGGKQVFVDVQGMMQLPPSSLPFHPGTLLIEDGYAALPAVLLKLANASSSDQLFETCSNLTAVCETLLLLSSTILIIVAVVFSFS